MACKKHESVKMNTGETILMNVGSPYLKAYTPFTEQEAETIMQPQPLVAIIEQSQRFEREHLVMLQGLMASAVEFDDGEFLVPFLHKVAAISNAFYSRYGTLPKMGKLECDHANEQILELRKTDKCSICNAPEPKLMKQIFKWLIFEDSGQILSSDHH